MFSHVCLCHYVCDLCVPKQRDVAILLFVQFPSLSFRPLNVSTVYPPSLTDWRKGADSGANTHCLDVSLNPLLLIIIGCLSHSIF